MLISLLTMIAAKKAEGVCQNHAHQNQVRLR